MSRRLVLAVALLVALPLFASTYTVDDNADTPDNNPGNNICATIDGVCTLRAAIMEANAHAGADTIAFSVAAVFNAATNYQTITDVVTIDGTTAPGYAAPVVHIVASAAAADVGLDSPAAGRARSSGRSKSRISPRPECRSAAPTSRCSGAISVRSRKVPGTASASGSPQTTR